MDVSDAIRKRRSIRRFTAKKVPKGVILGALEAALWAPSAGNVQDREFIVIKDKATKESLVKAVFDQVWVAHAPVIIVLISDVNKLRLKFGKRAEFYATFGSGMAAENLLLYLTSQGLQGTHVGLFDEVQVKRILGVPDDKRVFSIITLGYPAEKPPVPYRLDLKNITSLESYGAHWVKHKPGKTYLE